MSAASTAAAAGRPGGVGRRPPGTPRPRGELAGRSTPRRGVARVSSWAPAVRRICSIGPPGAVTRRRDAEAERELRADPRRACRDRARPRSRRRCRGPWRTRSSPRRRSCRWPRARSAAYRPRTPRTRPGCGHRAAGSSRPGSAAAACSTVSTCGTMIVEAPASRATPIAVVATGDPNPERRTHVAQRPADLHQAGPVEIAVLRVQHQPVEPGAGQHPEVVDVPAVTPGTAGQAHDFLLIPRRRRSRPGCTSSTAPRPAAARRRWSPPAVAVPGSAWRCS